MKKAIKTLFSRVIEQKTALIETEQRLDIEENTPEKSKRNFFFIHIPKTAGTSFRKSLEDQYTVIADYGSESGETAIEIKEHAYISHNPYLLKSILSNTNFDWLCGHVTLQKYIDIVPVTNTVAFVREPLTQFISHYNHFVHKHGFKGDIMTFLSTNKGAINCQHRYLDFLPLGLIGCVGLTEKYDESLLLINDHSGSILQSKSENINHVKALEKDTLDESIKQLILEKNYLDIKLYEEATFIFQQRFRLFNAKVPWVFGYANITINKALYGCAYFAKSLEAVVLSIHKNGEEINQIKAQGFYSRHCKANFPRERYIGFHYPLSKTVNSDDVFDVYVKDTGQKINYQGLRIND